MTGKYVVLQNRALISLTGEDRISFLQGLVTNDINQVNSHQAVYAAMLSPQGRFLYDFFILADNEKLLLDVDKSKIDEIIKKLSIYKLRAKVAISRFDNNYYSTAFFDIDRNKITNEMMIFADPRDVNMGFRAFVNKDDMAKLIETHNLESHDMIFYDRQRLRLKIADNSDLGFDQSLIIEYGFDNINAINYQKGCYIGQETTARTHYKGVVRKGLYRIAIAEMMEIKPQTEITCEDKKMGLVLSSVFFDNRLEALALIKNTDHEGKALHLNNLDLHVADKKISILNYTNSHLK